MTFYRVSRPSIDEFLSNPDETPATMGPGTYDANIKKSLVVDKARPELGYMPDFSFKTIAELAQYKKPAFNSITAARPDDIRKWEVVFPQNNPSPDHYPDAKPGIASKFVCKDYFASQEE